MRNVVSVNPFECRLWYLHDRLDDLITEETCSEEIKSFLHHGQLVPALGRPLHGDPTHKIELIYGARRLFVARHLNLPLSVELRELQDREAIIAMDIENRQRTDVSAYERGLSYARWIHAGQFKSQDEISRVLKVSASQVSRLLSLAKLPAAVIGAFSHPAEIREGWGLELLAALEDHRSRPLLLGRAREIAQTVPRMQGRHVYRTLLSATAPGRKLRPKPHDEVVTDANGCPLFRIQYKTRSIALQLPLEKTSAESLAKIRRLVVGILSDG